ncbi:hypothetical protein D3C80_1651160 [compost metagenome]
MLCALDVTFLRRLVTSRQQQVNHLVLTGVVDAVAGTVMNTHFMNSFADCLTIAEVSVFGGSKPGKKTGLADGVLD